MFGLRQQVVIERRAPARPPRTPPGASCTAARLDHPPSTTQPWGTGWPAASRRRAQPPPTGRRAGPRAQTARRRQHSRATPRPRAASPMSRPRRARRAHPPPAAAGRTARPGRARQEGHRRLVVLAPARAVRAPSSSRASTPSRPSRQLSARTTTSAARPAARSAAPRGSSARASCAEHAASRTAHGSASRSTGEADSRRVEPGGRGLGEQRDAVLTRALASAYAACAAATASRVRPCSRAIRPSRTAGREGDPALLRRRAGEDELGDRLGLAELARAPCDVDEGSARLAQNVAVVRAEFDGAAGVGLGPREIGGVEVHLGADREVAGRLEGRVRSGRGVLLGPVEEGQALVGAPGLGRADPGASGHLGPDVGRAVAAGEDPLEDLARLAVPHRGVQRGEDPVGERVATSARRRRRTGRLDRDAHDGEVGAARPHRRCRRAGPPG